MLGYVLKKDGTSYDISKLDMPCHDMPVTGYDKEIEQILSNKMQSIVNRILTLIWFNEDRAAIQ